MNFLLDTDICSAHLRRPAKVAHRFIQHAGGLAIPTIVLAELYAEAYKHPSLSKLLPLIADPRMPAQEPANAKPTRRA